MASIEEHLRRWLGAGVVDEVTAEAIRTFERAQPVPRRQGPGLMEVLVYLGVAVVCVGVVILVGESWEEMEDWARVAVIGLPAVLAIGAGQGLRSAGRAELERGGQLAWLAGEGLLAGTVAVLADSAGWDGEDVAVAATLTATVAALVLWAISPSHLQVVGVGVALYAFPIALGERIGEAEDAAEIGFYGAAAFGAAALVLAELGLFRPRLTAQLAGAVLLGFGTFAATMAAGDGPKEGVIFVVGAALIAASIWRGVFLYVILGVGLVFAGLINTVARHAPNETVAALALIVIGGLLVATVLVLAQKRPWVARGPG